MRFKKYILVLFLFLVCFISNTDCVYCSNLKHSDDIKTIKILATVNGEPITNFDVLNYIENINSFENMITGGSLVKYFGSNLNDINECLEILIDRKLILLKLKDFMLKFKKEDGLDPVLVSTQIDKIVKVLGLSSKEELANILNVDDIQKFMEDFFILSSGIISLCESDVIISNKDVINYYDSNKSNLNTDIIADITLFIVNINDIQSNFKSSINTTSSINTIKGKIKRCRSSDEFKNIIFKYFGDNVVNNLLYEDIPGVELYLLKMSFDNNLDVKEDTKFYGPFNKGDKLIFFRLNSLMPPKELSFKGAYTKIVNILSDREKVNRYKNIIKDLRLPSKNEIIYYQ